MRIHVKLFAALGRYLPAGARANEAEVEVAEGMSADDVIRQLRIPGNQCHLVLINGHFVPPGERARRLLQERDALAIWPPVAGG
jgi:thiamine biosynthesis protein ThiS